MKNKFLLLFAVLFGLSGKAGAQYQWIPQVSGTSAYLNCLSVISADTVYASSDAGAVFKTVNGGTSWSQVGTGPIAAMVFTGNLDGYGAGNSEIISTQNGGTTWSSSYSNPNISDFWDIYFPDKNHGYAAAWSVDLANYVVKTSDAGATWDTIYKYNDNLALFNTIYFRDALNGFVGCDNGTLLKTSDGGATFTSTTILPGTMINSIYFPVADTGYLATESVGVFRSIDGGSSWTPLSFSFPNVVYSVWFISANKGFAAGGSGMGSMLLYETSDAGNTWTQSASGIQTLSKVAFADSMPGYAVGSNGTILKYVFGSAVENFEINAGLEVSPNPATDFTVISSTTETPYCIFSTEGVAIKSGMFEKGVNILPLAGYAKGTYFIKYMTGKGSGITRFVKL